jgi:hypothetical protein
VANPYHTIVEKEGKGRRKKTKKKKEGAKVMVFIR